MEKRRLFHYIVIFLLIHLASCLLSNNIFNITHNRTDWTTLEYDFQTATTLQDNSKEDSDVTTPTTKTSELPIAISVAERNLPELYFDKSQSTNKETASTEQNVPEQYLRKGLQSTNASETSTEQNRPEFSRSSLQSTNSETTSTELNSRKIVSKTSERTSTKQTLLYSLNTVPAMTRSYTASTTKLANSLPTTATIIDPCYNEGTCQFVTAMEHRYCQCQSDCLEYNDCCSNVSTTGVKVSKYHDYWRCFNPTNTPFYYGGFFAVGTCPKGYDNMTIISRCHKRNIQTNGPCVLHNRTIAFANKFCAFCHGIEDFETFKIKFVGFKNARELLHDDTIFLNKSSKGKFAVFIEKSNYVLTTPPGVNLRPCISSTITSSNETCKDSPINPVFRQIRGALFLYRNRYCAPVETYDYLICVGLYYKRMNDLQKFNLYPLSVMFSFETDLTQSVVESESSCSIWTSEIQENGMCKNAEIYEKAPLNLPIVRLSTSGIELAEDDFKIAAFVFAWSFQISNFLDLRKAKFKRENKNSMYVHLHDIIILKPVFLKELRAINKRMEKINWTAIFIDKMNGLQTSIRKQTINESSTIRASNLRVYFSDTIRKWLVKNTNVTFSNQPNGSVCNNMTLQIVREISRDVHVTFHPCTDEVNLEDQSLPNETISFETLFTYISFSISTLSLIILFIINRKIKLASGIAGANLENLAIIISTSDIAFMVGIGNSSNPWVCYCAGVALHYLWLNAFCFMLISEQFIVRNLTKIRNKSLQEDQIGSKRCCITIFGLLLPLIFVIPSVIVDNIGPKSIAPGYGRSVCFPNQFPGNIIFFSGPVLFFLVISLISFVRLVVEMTRLRLEIRRVSNTANFINAKVFLRILCVSNLLWIFGVVVSIIDISWLRLAFTLICGLQGLFILIASITTTRFARLVGFSKNMSNIRTFTVYNINSK